MDKYLFEQRIKVFIKRDGHNQAGIARRLGYSRDQFNKWVRGVNRMPDTAIQEVADFLELNDEERIELFTLAGYVAPAQSANQSHVPQSGISAQSGTDQMGSDPQSQMSKRGVAKFAAKIVALIGLSCLTIGGIAVLFGYYVNTTGNYPVASINDSSCTPPPPVLDACPFTDQAQTVQFPLTVEQCQAVQDNYYMRTRASLSKNGQLKAITEILADSYLFGFTGRATVYFCNNNQEIHKMSHTWGVNGRAIFGASPYRVRDWDCPKGDVNQDCYDQYAPLNVVDQDILTQTTYLNIVHIREETRSPRRLENTLQHLKEFLAIFN